MGIMPPAEEAVRSVLARRKDETVMLVSDIHVSSDQSYGFAEKLAQQSRSALAVEMLMPDSQPLLDALREGKITKSDFRALAPDLWVNEGKSPAAGTPQYYMGVDRGNALYDGLIDTAAKGTPVVGIGRYEGMPGQVKDMPEFSQAYKDMLVTDSQIRLDVFLEVKKDAAKIVGDPRAYLESQMKSASGKLGDEYINTHQSGINARNILENPGTFTGADFLHAIEDVMKYNHPRWQDYERYEQEFQQLQRDNPDRIGAGGDLETRRKIDSSIARDIGDIEEKYGSVVAVYGINHFSHGEKDGGDIDHNLREMGKKVMVVDPLTGQVPPDMKETMSLFRDSAAKEGDPNRLQVNLDTGRIEDEPATVRQQKLAMNSFGAPGM